jgi:hypothetical protein
MDEEEKCCRICLEPDKRINLIAPCSCAGSQKWVHRDCLNRWRATREDHAFSRCTECLTSYVLISPKDEKNAKYWGNLRFYCFCLRDISLALIFILFLTMLFGLIIYEIDHTKYLASLLSIEHKLKLFYWSCGLFLFLSLVGILSSLALCLGIGDMGDYNCHCGPGCCRTHDFYLPLYFNSDPSCCCCCSTHECSSCTACCETGTLCEGCTAASCEQEALIFLLIGLVIFAIIGIFVSVVIGFLFVQKIANSHIHYLHKQVLARDYVVKDLDTTSSDANVGDIEMGESNKMIASSSQSSNQEYHLIRSHLQEGLEERSVGYMSISQQQELDRLGLL